MSRRPVLACLLATFLSPVPEVWAWPPELMLSLFRDARRLLPASLSRLLGEREETIAAELRRFPPELAQLLADDLALGRLQPPTLAALREHVGEVAELLRQKRVSEGLVRLGATLRIPADLSDPAMCVGPAGYPPGVVREYYAFVSSNLGKIPVVLDDSSALVLEPSRLPAYWQSLLSSSREKSHIIRAELYRSKGLGVIDHRSLDFRNPVFGVAQISYSRAVTAIAGTWLVLWRDANGDTSTLPRPKELRPKEDNGARP